MKKINTTTNPGKYKVEAKKSSSLGTEKVSLKQKSGSSKVGSEIGDDARKGLSKVPTVRFKKCKKE